MYQLIKTNSGNPDFSKLIALLDTDLRQRNGTLQQQYNAFNSVDTINNVLIAYADNLPVACGCFKPFDTTRIEIKRLFVVPVHRGTGLAVKLLGELEQWASELGYTRFVLETGHKQTEAIGLYTKCGYSVIDNYGPYEGNANSICFEKQVPRMTIR